MKKQPSTGRTKSFLLSAVALSLMVSCQAFASAEVNSQVHERKTRVTITGEQFHINGVPAYEGRTWTTSYGGEYPIEGLLMNARLVQGIFDDLNGQTAGQWAYPDTGEWDAGRNTGEFIDAMASWREHGLLAFTINLQGGCPYGYCTNQPWDNSAFAPDGSLRDDFMGRMEGIIDRADELGMVVILGYFYFGQDENLVDEGAVIRAVENATRWVLKKGYTNVIIEINNECSVRAYDHEILECRRVHELISLARDIKVGGRSLYVTTSLAGGGVPPPNIVEVSDYILLHGNGVRDPRRMREMIEQVRQMAEYRPMPVVNNEDDQPWRVADQGWGEKGNNLTECVSNYTSWGYFDFRRQEEHHDYNLGFQSIPANWQVSSDRKRDFFDLLAAITGYPGTPLVSAGFSSGIGSVDVQIEREVSGMSGGQVMLIVNNEVVETLSRPPWRFELRGIPSGEHWVKARLVYTRDGREVIVESSYYRNPWWPYGGPR